MASPRDLTGVLRWWSADAPAELDGGRVASAPDLVAAAPATRFGQGRVGPEALQVDGRPAWRFGGSASPASLLTPDVPPVSGAPYTWAVVLAPLSGYAGQVVAPGPNTGVTSSSAQLLAGTSGSFRWEGFAGATLTLPMPSGEHLVVLEHDGGSGATRLYASGQGSSRATLQRRSLAGQQHLGRHGSNDRPLHADVRAIVLLDHALSDAEVATLEQWRAEGASSRTTTVHDAGALAFPGRTRTAAALAARRDVATVAPARARVAEAAAHVRAVAVVATARTRTAAVTSAARDVAAPLAASARFDVPAVAARAVAVTATSRARLAAEAAAARRVDVAVRARAGLAVELDGARDVDVAVALPALARLQAATAAVRAVEAAAPASSRLSATTRALRAVAPVLPARALTDALTAATAVLDVLARAAARFDVATSRPVTPLPPDGGRDVTVTTRPPRRTWTFGDPDGVWRTAPPRRVWRFGPPYR